MTEPITREGLSPAQIEDKLRRCVTDLTRAELALREARDTETVAEIEYQRAKRRAMLSPDCPTVSRSGATAAERDAWVDDRCDQEWTAYRLAHTSREAAQDHSRTVRDITSAVQSIASLTRAAFSLAGVDR